MSRPHRSHDDCPSCGSQQMIRVALTLAGSPASFTMCNVCEWKAWERDGELLALGSVLTIVSAR